MGAEFLLVFLWLITMGYLFEAVYHAQTECETDLANEQENESE